MFLNKGTSSKELQGNDSSGISILVLLPSKEFKLLWFFAKLSGILAGFLVISFLFLILKLMSTLKEILID